MLFDLYAPRRFRDLGSEEVTCPLAFGGIAWSRVRPPSLSFPLPPAKLTIYLSATSAFRTVLPLRTF